MKNKKDIRLFLEQTSVPDEISPTHKRALKYVLLSEYEDKKKFNFIEFFVKGGERIIMQHKLSSFGVIGVVTILLVLGFLYAPQILHTPQAEAQELMDRVITTVDELSPEDRQKIEQKMKADLEQSLEEAKKATDLEIVSHDEITRMDPPKTGGDIKFFRVGKNADGKTPETAKKPVIKHAPFPGKLIAPENVTLMRYTDPQGRKVVLGIDKNNVPVMKMIRLEEGQMPKDGIGHPAEKIEFHMKLDK